MCRRRGGNQHREGRGQIKGEVKSRRMGEKSGGRGSVGGGDKGLKGRG